MKVVAIVQARMGSTRLPGKVLLDLAGEPMLARVVKRAHRAIDLHEVVIATTTQPPDKIIVELCLSRGWPYFCGSEEDVLDRFYWTAREYKADIIVRITSDCPLVEPEIIDRSLREFWNNEPLDYASTILPPKTFPYGIHVEVMTFEALARSWREDNNPAWREHVTPYIHQQPGKFRLHAVVNEVDYSSMRWAVDTPEDLRFARHIYDYFGHDHFSWQDVLTVLEHHPEWLEINRHVPQKHVL